MQGKNFDNKYTSILDNIGNFNYTQALNLINS